MQAIVSVEGVFLRQTSASVRDGCVHQSHIGAMSSENGTHNQKRPGIVPG